MDEEMDKNIQLERTVFFCDAVVAIAITLLALDLKPEHISGAHFTFPDLWSSLRNFPAFVLSFLNIASFWRIHHMFFANIRKVDQKLLVMNIAWLFFIVLLPFSTSLLSSYFFDTAATFAYCLNTLLITIAQNMIWDYSSAKADFIDKEKLGAEAERQMQIFCNLDILNALVAVGLCFLSPLTAFIFLYTKLPMIVVTRLFWSKLFGPVPKRERPRFGNKGKEEGKR